MHLTMVKVIILVNNNLLKTLKVLFYYSELLFFMTSSLTNSVLFSFTSQHTFLTIHRHESLKSKFGFDLNPKFELKLNTNPPSK